MSVRFLCAKVVWKIENFHPKPIISASHSQFELCTPIFKIETLWGTSWCICILANFEGHKFFFYLKQFKTSPERNGIYVDFDCYVSGVVLPLMNYTLTESSMHTSCISMEKFFASYCRFPSETRALCFRIFSHHHPKMSDLSYFFFKTIVPEFNSRKINFNFLMCFEKTTIETRETHSTSDSHKCNEEKPSNSGPNGENLIERATLSLQNDLHNMYRSGRFSDFTLRVQDKDFPVHSLIMSARSLVFDRMLDTNMKETKEKVLVLDDLDEDTVSRMLNYMYSDNPGEIGWTEALKLYYAADKYDIRGLKEKASCVLVNNTNENNVLEILELADRHNDVDLKSASVQIVLGHEHEVMTSEEMEKLTLRNPGLVAKTAIEIAKLRKK